MDDVTKIIAMISHKIDELAENNNQIVKQNKNLSKTENGIETGKLWAYLEILEFTMILKSKKAKDVDSLNKINTDAGLSLDSLKNKEKQKIIEDILFKIAGKELIMEKEEENND